MEPLYLLPFPGAKAKHYLLYTGQHYDPLVGAATPETSVDDEVSDDFKKKIRPLPNDTLIPHYKMGWLKNKIIRIIIKAAVQNNYGVLRRNAAELASSWTAFTIWCSPPAIPRPPRASQTLLHMSKSSQVITLPEAKSQAKDKRAKDRQ
jgi:hypothetical protein